MKKLFFVQFFLCAAIVASAQNKGSWIKRAGKLNSRAISKEEIQQFAADEERDTRNKISLRRIKPRTGKTDWDTDPTAIPFMLYQVKMRTGLSAFEDCPGWGDYTGMQDIYKLKITVFLNGFRKCFACGAIK